MSKLRIEKGASRVRRVTLKTTIDGTVADDIELLCRWSENETSYIVTELLRFALAQSEDFQEYKRIHPQQAVVTKVHSTAKPDRLKERQAEASSAPTAPDVSR